MVLKKILIGIIKLYQMMPLSTHSMCRFIPRCSDYTIQSLEEHGTFKGLNLGIKRILRCRPGGKYGYDPVPKNKKEKKHEKII